MTVRRKEQAYSKFCLASCLKHPPLKPWRLDCYPLLKRPWVRLAGFSAQHLAELAQPGATFSLHAA